MTDVVVSDDGVDNVGVSLRSPQLPEPGQVVEVRGTTWAVADVRAQGLPRSPADEYHSMFSHVVTLQSLTEDRLGEELSASSSCWFCW